MNNFKNMMKLAAVSVATASLVGCATPQYMGTLSQEDKDFKAKKEAYENQGYKVEAIMTPDGKATYGIRQKTWNEGLESGIRNNAGILTTGAAAGALTLGIISVSR